MDRIDVYKLNNGKLHCKVFRDNSALKNLSDNKTKKFMSYLEESLNDNRYRISYKPDSFCISVDDAKIHFHDYQNLKRELKKYMPATLEEINEFYKKDDKKKVIKYRKVAKKTGLYVALALTGILLTDNFKLVTRAGSIPVKEETIFNDDTFNFSSNDDELKINTLQDSEIEEESENFEENSEIITQESTEENIESQAEEIQSYDYSIDIDCSDRSSDDDVIALQSQYKETVEKLSQKWGVSSSLIYGMMTQESHCTGDNLMQIQSWSIMDEVMTVYNFNTNQYASYVLTNNPGKYSNTITTISPNELKNPFTNISVATILYRHIIDEYTNGNPLTAVEVYNKGIANFNKNLSVASKKTGKTIDELKNDLDDTTFMEYSYVCGQGDSNYVSNVMQYVKDGFSIKMLDENNQIYTINYSVNKTQERGLSR